MGRFDALQTLVEAIGAAEPTEWDGLRDQLLAASRTHDDATTVIEFLESAKKSLSSLEARWEIDEVIEAITPAPEPAEPEPEEEKDPNKLSASDLVLVYDDPRGLRVHRSKTGDRWFLTQVDPRTYQPQTYELRPEEIEQLKVQLDGSPYWVLGAGGANP